MNRWVIAVTLAALTCVTGCEIQVENASSSDGLLFADNFDGPAGSAPDPAHWNYDIGGGGWGNNETQTYTDSVDNARVDGDGHLVIEARNGGPTYTSARLTTKDRFDFVYGRAEARIQLPRGEGLHPAFWLLGSDLDRVGWPESGEIDVIETVNAATSYHGGLHGPSDAAAGWAQYEDRDQPGSLADGFHTYWVNRTPGRIELGIDQTVTRVFRESDMAAPDRWVFEKPFLLILNIAVGGNWSGPVGPQSVFPARMLVDWVRVSSGG